MSQIKILIFVSIKWDIHTLSLYKVGYQNWWVLSNHVLHGNKNIRKLLYVMEMSRTRTLMPKKCRHKNEIKENGG